MNKIPFKKLDFSIAEKEVNKLLASGFIGLGDKVFEFERELANYLGVKEVIATDSCTSALFISMKYENPKEVTIPAITVPLVADAVIEAGAILKFNGETQWVGSAYKLGGTDIIDSAHQLERDLCKSKISIDEKVCFSFYPTKPIGSADGGAIATNDVEFAKWARQIITYGRNQSQKYQNSWEFDVNMVGYKRHYTNLQAAICLEQLKRLDYINDKRRQVLKRFNQAFGLDNESLYLYRIEVKNRDKFIEYMASHGIECGVHFKPLYMMSAFQNIYIDAGSRALVNAHYEKTVSLPFYAELTVEEQDYIIKKVKEYESINSSR